MKFKQLLNNHVILRVDSFFGDTIKLQSGMVLHIDTATRNPRYATTKGEVVQVPDHLVCCDGKNHNALEWVTPVQIQPGDTVWFQYDAMITATKDQELHWVQNDQLYIVVNYRWLYVVRRGEQIIPLNGYCLVEPVYEEISQGMIIQTPKKIKDRAKVLHLGVPNERYLEAIYSDDADIAVGDTVQMAPSCDIPLEYDLYRSFDKDREIYRIQRRYILGKVEI